MKTRTEEEFQRRLRAIKRLVASRLPRLSPGDVATPAAARDDATPRRRPRSSASDRTAFVAAIA